MTAAPLIDWQAQDRCVTDRLPKPRRYLMCPPRYFSVRYSINVWMNPAYPVDSHLAMAQWSKLVETYRRLGHQVEEIKPEPGLPDMVFSANSGTVIGGRVLGSRFRSTERFAEAEHFRRWFTEHGYRSVVMPQMINEAEGDFAWTGRFLLAGTGFRTEEAAHREASEVLGVPVLSLRLVDPRYYHLDTALFVLSDDPERPEICYYPDAFSADSRETLRRLFPDAVLADAMDALFLGCNAVSDGYHVVLPMEATALGERLAGRGYHPIHVDISELRKSGGGPKCCTMEIRD